MTTYKVRNKSTKEERIPVKMEWNDRGELVILQVNGSEGIENIEHVDNWVIVPIHAFN